MKHIFKMSLMALVCGIVVSGAKGAEIKNLSDLADNINVSAYVDCLDCDTVVRIDGYAVRVIKENGEFRHLGLNLLPDDLKNANDREMLDFIETGLLAKAKKIGYPNVEKIFFINGGIGDLKNVDSFTDFNVSTVKGKDIFVDWRAADKRITVAVPVAYDVMYEGTRSDIENDFIRRLRKGGASRKSFGEVRKDNIEPYIDSLYVLPGGSFRIEEVTRNVYFSDNDSLQPVWNKAYPAESVSNLMLYPAEIYGNPDIELTVIKHEYGEKEELTIPLNQLLATAENEGCLSFFGVEKFANGELFGSLYFYNPDRAYNHLVRMKLNPQEIIEGAGKIKGRVSLYIPTNNIENLFMPYEKRSEDEEYKFRL